MKKTLFTIALFLGLSSHANTPSFPVNSADYIVEVNTLIISGKVAEDLYNSLKAKVVADRLNTNWSAIYTKSNRFASCKISQSRYEDKDEGSVWVTESAECQLRAPRGTVDNGT